MQGNRETIRVRLNYPADRVEDPIIYKLIKDFGLVLNILRASVEPCTGSYVFVELSGEREALERALAFLHESGIGVNAIGLDGVTEWGI
jgi:ABC-type methionine transport system ATPase subunit